MAVALKNFMEGATFMLFFSLENDCVRVLPIFLLKRLDRVLFFRWLSMREKINSVIKKRNSNPLFRYIY